MGTFGVSSNIGACSSHIMRNPVTLAAIKRQQEKEQERPAPNFIQRRKIVADIRAQEKAKAEWNFRFNFLQMTYAARAFHLANNPPKPIEDAVDVVAHYKSTVVRDNIRGIGFRVTGEQIIQLGAAQSGFTVDEIKGKSRLRQLGAVRQHLMVKVSDECPWLSLPQVGKLFGGRDHTTVLHAINKLGGRRASKRKTPQLSQAA